MKKRVFITMLAVICAVCLPAQVYALDSGLLADEFSERVSPRIGCTVCKMGMCYSVCAQDNILYDTATHTYNWGQGRCTAKYYRCTGYYKCDMCGSTRPMDYVDLTGGQHNCFEVHSSCSRGTYRYCPLGSYL